VRLRALADRCRRSGNGRRYENDDRTAVQPDPPSLDELRELVGMGQANIEQDAVFDGPAVLVREALELPQQPLRDRQVGQIFGDRERIVALLVRSTLENTTSAAKIEPGAKMAIEMSLPSAVRRAMRTDVLKEPYTRGLPALRYIMRTALDWRPGHFLASDDSP